MAVSVGRGLWHSGDGGPWRGPEVQGRSELFSSVSFATFLPPRSLATFPLGDGADTCGVWELAMELGVLQ